MTRSFSGSCSTSSTPPSAEHEPRAISRRSLLALSAAWVTVLAVADDASAAVPAARAAAPAPAPSEAPPSHVSYEDDSIEILVDAGQVQDVTVLRCTVTNRSTDGGNYKLSYVDGKTGKESRPRTVMIASGQTRITELYGGLNRDFVVRVCPLSATDCIELGPVGSQGLGAAKAAGVRIIR